VLGYVVVDVEIVKIDAKTASMLPPWSIDEARRRT
jgi:hypothetical protein